MLFLKRSFWRALQVLALLQVLASTPVRPVHAQDAAPKGSYAAAFSEPLFWADGIVRADELEAYQAMGLNTVVVRLTWAPSPDGALDAEDLRPQQAFARAAAARGLKVIYALPPAPFGMERGFRVSASSTAYFTLWTAWTAGAIALLRDTPGLLGWMLPDDPRGLPFLEEVGWQKWLRENFAAVGFVNNQWKAGFASMEDASLQNTAALIAAWRGGPTSSDGLTAEDIEALEKGDQQKRDPTWMFHPASLSVAQARWDAYRELVAAWAGSVKELDPARPVFSGRLPDYAQLLSLPPSVDVSVPDLRPGVAESDALTHNPQAIDIARRGGRFRAVPTLSTRASPAVAGEYLPLLLPKWADAALSRGASGLAFDWWPALLENEALRRAATRTLERLTSPDMAGLWGRAPISTGAMVLTPLADGVTLQAGGGQDGTLPERRGLYGFGEDLLSNEPSDLVYALRWGTAFGSLDVLSPDDFSAGGDELARYSTVLMPAALSLSNEQIGALTRYVGNGGALVADMGAGARQAGGQVATLPQSLANLFGIVPAMAVRRTSGNWRLAEEHPLLPTWGEAFEGRGGAILTDGDGPRGVAFAGLMGYPLLTANARIIAVGDQWPRALGRPNNRAAPTQLLRTGLVSHPVGRGWAFFTPSLMWTHWRPGHSGFDAFHGDLLARNATLSPAGAPSLVPSPPLARGALAFPQIVNFSDRVLLLNHNPPPARAIETQSSAVTRPQSAPASTSPLTSQSEGAPQASPGDLQAVIQTAGVGEFLWSEGVTLFDPSAPFGVAGGRPSPIASPDEWENRPHAAVLQVLVPAGEMRSVRLLPVRAQNQSGGPLSSHVARYGAQGVQVQLWPNAREVSRGQDGEGGWDVVLAEPAMVRLSLHDSSAEGSYRVAPGSRHRVSVRSFSPGQALEKGNNRKAPAPQGTPRGKEQIHTADERGRLVIEATGAAVEVEIAPAP
jgi:hypothetical protein